jgi:N-acetylglucosamine kinase-like BadF-type ATPase
VAIADETGRVLGLGEGGSGNPDNVGYEGLSRTLEIATRSAVQQAGVALDQITGAGFGVSGLDYPSQKAPTLQVIRGLGLCAPVEAVNDALIG